MQVLTSRARSFCLQGCYVTGSPAVKMGRHPLSGPRASHTVGQAHRCPHPLQTRGHAHGLSATSQLSPITAEAQELCGLRHPDQPASPWIPEACHWQGRAGRHQLPPARGYRQGEVSKAQTPATGRCGPTAPLLSTTVPRATARAQQKLAWPNCAATGSHVPPRPPSHHV